MNRFISRRKILLRSLISKCNNYSHTLKFATQSESKCASLAKDLTSTYPWCDHEMDCLIIGAGGAGLRTAYSLTEAGFRTAVVTKLYPIRSHTIAAQGGVNAALGNMEPDDWRWHMFDTVKGSDWLGDQDAIHVLCREAPRAIIELENNGLPFSRTNNGKIYQRAFGGQTYNYGKGGQARRTCACADTTGHAMLHTLYGMAVKQGCLFFNEYFAVDLIMDENGSRCFGAVAICMEDGTIHRFVAKNTIVCTGGAGRCYFSTTNALSCTGDGMSMVSRAGLPLQDLEFVQFHPTGLYGSGILITEGARGEGGYILNANGERFMKKYAPKALELASRDVVARAIGTEILEGRGVGPEKDHVLLQISHLPLDVLQNRLPGIILTAKTFAAVDLTKEPAPIIPTVHYTMGGVPTNYKGQVITHYSGKDEIVHGLWAAGETACASVHGANRLGANSLLEIVVFGKMIAETIKTTCCPGDDMPVTFTPKHGYKILERIDRVREARGKYKVNDVKTEMQKIMQKYNGIFRRADLLAEGVKKMKELSAKVNDISIKDRSMIWNTDLIEALELQGMYCVALQMIAAAEKRTESRGAHFRNDYKLRIDEFNYAKEITGQQKKCLNEHWRKHTLTWLPERGEVVFDYRPVIDYTLDPNEVNSIEPQIRKY